MSQTPLQNAEARLRLFQSSLSSLSSSIAGVEGVAFTVPRVRDVSAGMYKDDGKNPFQDELPLGLGEGAGMYKPEGSEHGFIPVYPLRGVAAVKHLSSGLEKIVRLRNQPPTKPDRFPGVLVCGKHPAVAAALATVAEAKKQLLDALDGLGETPEARRDARAGSHEEALRHLMLMELLREPHVIEQEVEHIGFSWSGNSRSVSPISRAKVISMLQAMNRLDATASEWEKKLREVPGEWFAIVRALEPFPVANLTYRVDDLVQGAERADALAEAKRLAAETGTKLKRPKDTTRERKTAVLPILLMANRKMPELVHLSGFDYGAKKRDQRVDNRVGDCVIPALHVYQYTGEPKRAPARARETA